MTPERWEQIDQLFHDALNCDPAARVEFLDRKCAGDESLRQEVESLISFHEESEDFIDKPEDVAAEMLGAHRSQLDAGDEIGNYRIVRQLGSGGMGIVYLADDLRLHRKIALKILPPQFTVNPDRVRRFEREALAASALNHPNIVTIYEIGKSNSVHFIATEFVDGKTLRQLMNERPLTLHETLNVTIQIVEGLIGAHASGIVHRDIKPENIMIRSDGYLKILDFGLAKLDDHPETNSADDTPTLLQSNPGLVMGTVQYMSPEQARGKRVDARTDTWSLGIVLYELVMGHVPFQGETSSHVMVSLMEDELPPLAGYSNIPAELDRIVTKALRKKPDERYQTPGQFGRDLQALKRELESEADAKEILKAVPLSDQPHTATGHRKSLTQARTASIATAESTYLASRFKFSPRLLTFTVVGLIVAIGLVFGIAKFLTRRSISAAMPFQNVEMVRLTNNGKVSDATISYNGRLVAYVADNRGKNSIWLRDVESSNNVELVPPADHQIYGETFARDDKQIYYIAKERNNSIGVLHRVSIQGGSPAKLIVDVDGPISLSPDGTQLAFVRGFSTGERALMVANADGTGETKLASRVGYDAFSFGGPAWSPDGKSIACGAQYVEGSDRYESVVAVDLSEGAVRRITQVKWKWLGRISWLHDGSGLIFNASELGQSATSQLWRLSYPGGEANRITRDLHEYDGVSLSSDSKILVTKQFETLSSLWIVPNNDANGAQAIVTHKEDDSPESNYFYRTRFSWTPAGDIIYTSLVNRTSSIWTMTAQGTNQKQLTTAAAADNFPQMTADGRYVVFVSERSGLTNVWRMNSDGSGPTQLSKGEDDSWAWCSPDSRYVVYHSGQQGRRTLWKTSIDGGKPQQLTDYPSIGPVVSPDGKWISFYYRPELKAPWKLAILSIEGGAPVKTFEIPPNVVFASLVRWTPDGLSLAYIMNRDGVSNIWAKPIDGGPAKQLTDFRSDQIFWFEWSPDGQQLGVSRGTVTSDVVLIRDLRP